MKWRQGLWQLIFIVVSAVLVVASLSACTTVQPYQRGILSKPEMLFDSEKVEAGARDHFLNSLEGSVGGFGVGGGGCGCN